ncbi:AAA family ATPase [Nonomuraea sp. NPDC052129]|uniref:AAA family ATPase n=1 Tax=unclassified Nonomuraea TaxID=2593643 RepID=UPI0033DD22DB
MHGFWEDDLTEQSHGEGFFTVLERMVSGPGLYLMDEPEAALSFHSCVRLIGLMNRVAREDGQIVCATHSPLLTSLPGAQIIELGGHGIRTTEWENLRLVDDWRRFLAKPDFYLRYALDED